MPNRNSNSILTDLESFSEKFNELNLVSQAHARAILSENSDPEYSWPNFNKNIDQRLYYAANYQILGGLSLLDYGEHQNEAKSYLKQGAESLEYLYRYLRIDDEIRINILIKSIFAYYISGNYAQAYVLTKELEQEELNSIPILNLISTFLKKDLKKARFMTLDLLTEEKYDDEKLTSELLKGKICKEDAISEVLTFSTFKAVSYFLEYIKTGVPQLFDDSKTIIDTSLRLAQEFNLVDLWWLIYCFSYILDEFNDRNLWVNLKPFKDKNNLIKRYIKSYLRHEPPIIELWPSQIDSLPFIIDDDNRSFCLKMPTSAGKTQIAELTILKYLLETEDEDKKCVYIAPFRSLAAQVEKNLQQSLGSIGYKVSEIYGGFDLNPVDDLLIEESRILVMTPEKFDAIIRYMPKIKGKLGLIVIDEGHIIDPNQRGLKFEFFLQRLLSFYKDKDCRFLFISAVLPNAKDFAKWITGSSDQLVESNWKPSRLMIGRLVWDGNSVAINYTHENQIPFEQECSISNFIERYSCKDLPGIRKIKPYPKNAKECLAYSAIRFAQKGTTLIFAGKKNEVEPFGEVIIDAINFHKAIKKTIGEEFGLIKPGNQHLIDRCKDIIKSELGTDSILINFLNHGFVVHHRGLPHKVRIALEDLVRSNAVPLIIATSTLAEGVNLPIKTVLVKSLYHGNQNAIDPLKFWNICGRAGRAGKENEGQILFLIDETEKIQKQRRKISLINKLTDNLAVSNVISVIYKLLLTVVKKWEKTHPKVDVAELCIYLANQSNDWISENPHQIVRDLMDTLDSHLLALSEESNMRMTNPDDLEKIMERSLLYIQMENHPTAIIDKDLANKMLSARLNYIHSRYPNRYTRRSFYKLGMKLSDCDIIEDNWEELYGFFTIAKMWDELTNNNRINLLVEISEFLFNLSDIIGKRELPLQWKNILSLWLDGYSTVEMVENEEIRSYTDDPAKLREFIEDFFVYSLSWGFNSVLNYFSMFDNTELPTICSYFPSMIKNGVIDPKAVCILPYVNQEREKSLKLAVFCPLSYEKPKNTVKWFKNLTKDDLINQNIESTEIEEIIDLKNRFSESGSHEKLYRFCFYSNNNIINSLECGDKVLLVRDSEIDLRTIQVFTLEGKLIKTLTMREYPPKWIFQINIVNSEIDEIDEKEGNIYISIIAEM